MLIDGSDGAGNTAPYPLEVFDHVGRRGGLSAIHLGEGAVLTAHHVGAGDVVIGGVLYPCVPQSAVRLHNPDDTLADLVLFAIEPHPEQPPLAIADATPESGTFLVALGNGHDRGDPLAWDPNGAYPPPLVEGYAWAAGHSLRWGTNHAEVFPTGRILGTHVFGSRFESGRPGYEAQAAVGDSGGAVLAWDSTSGFALAGVILAISELGGQPESTSFYGQTTYYADLSVYREEILAAMALPEPRGVLWPAGALVVVLARVRRR